MKTHVRRVLASSLLGAGALVLVGCGGGGGGVGTPTATPIATTTGTPNATVTPTSTTPAGTGGSPVSSNEFAFVSNRSGVADLYKSSTSGSNVVRLTALNQSLDKPSVASDGSRLVFQLGQSNVGGGTNNLEIGLINTNGSGFQFLTADSTAAGRPDDYAPVFSPGDQYIYWTSTRGGTDETGQPVDGVPHIWRMDGLRGNAGQDQVQITHEPSAYPSFDRNGDLAYFAVNRRATTSDPIAIANLAGTVSKRIGGSVARGQNIYDVKISPDGSRVAFTLGVDSTSPTPTTSTDVQIYNVASNTAVTPPSSGTSSAFNRVGGWSRDSSTLYYDATVSGRREIFSSASPFSTSTQVSQGTSSDNYSPAFLP